MALPWYTAGEVLRWYTTTRQDSRRTLSGLCADKRRGDHAGPVTQARRATARRADSGAVDAGRERGSRAPGRRSAGERQRVRPARRPGRPGVPCGRFTRPLPPRVWSLWESVCTAAGVNSSHSRLGAGSPARLPRQRRTRAESGDPVRLTRSNGPPKSAPDPDGSERCDAHRRSPTVQGLMGAPLAF